MNTKRNIIAILVAVFVGATLCGCSYNELPPKTSDASKSYIKPKGEIPTAAERDVWPHAVAAVVIALFGGVAVTGVVMMWETHGVLLGCLSTYTIYLVRT